MQLRRKTLAEFCSSQAGQGLEAVSGDLNEAIAEGRFRWSGGFSVSFSQGLGSAFFRAP